MSEWISVKDKLPEYATPVLIHQIHDYCDFDGYHEIKIDMLLKSGKIDKWFCSEGFGYKVTHWMPFPEPPKKG